MRIEFKKISQAGNNLTCEMFFDGVRVSTQIHCTPKEFDEFYKLIENGYDATYTGPVEVYRDDKQQTKTIS